MRVNVCVVVCVRDCVCMLVRAAADIERNVEVGERGKRERVLYTTKCWVRTMTKHYKKNVSVIIIAMFDIRHVVEHVAILCTYCLYSRVLLHILQ